MSKKANSKPATSAKPAFNAQAFAEQIAAATTLEQTQALAEKLGASGLDEEGFAALDNMLGKKVEELEKAAPVPAPAVQHGQYGKRPAKAGKCRAVWDYLDSMVARGETPTSRTAKEVAAQQGWNVNNTVTEFYSWRKAGQMTNA